ncbi:hypothetical protein JCM8097_000946 [Rhodosporidiobolus ruineniae]
MHRPRRSSLTSPVSPVSPLSPAATPSSALHPSTGSSASSSSNLRRSPSSHLLSRLVPNATTAVCTAPSAASLPASSSREAPHRPRRLSTSNPVHRSAPIPISPTSPPRLAPAVKHPATAARGAKERGAVGERDQPYYGAGGGQDDLAYAIRHNDAALLYQQRGRYTSASILPPASKSGQGGEGSGSDGSDASYDVPIVDTSRAALLAGGGAYAPPTSGAGAGAGGLVGGVRYSNGRRMSSLATYTGLPQPPELANLDRGRSLGLGLGGPLTSPGAAASGREDLRYSIPASTSASMSGRRPPSPAGNALKPVLPLTRTEPAVPTTSSLRRPPSPARAGGGLFGGLTRRASSPVGTRPSAASLLGGGGGNGGATPSTPGTSSLLSSSSAALGRSSSTSTSSARRAPSPARTTSYGLLTPGSSVVRAPSPGGGMRSLGGRASGMVRAASPGPSPGSPPSSAYGAGGGGGGEGSGPRIVRGFDAPAGGGEGSHPHATPSPSYRFGTALSRGRSASQSTAGVSHPSSPSSSSASAIPRPSLPGFSSPSATAHTTTRPRSRLANRQLDERLEIRASRDFQALDEYYDARRRGRSGASAVEMAERAVEGEWDEAERAQRRREEERRARREAEERLRKGYDRLSGSQGGTRAA